MCLPEKRPNAREVLDALRSARVRTSVELPCDKAEDSNTEELRAHLVSLGLGSTPKLPETLSKLSQDCIIVGILETISKLDLEKMNIVRGHRIAIVNAQKVPDATSHTTEPCTGLGFKVSVEG